MAVDQSYTNRQLLPLVRSLDDMAQIASPQSTKVFCHRDFTNGTQVRFVNKFPPELEGKIDHQLFDHTLTQLNALYDKAEALSGSTYCESCFACLTAYLIYLCMETHYETCLKKISRFIQDQNDKVYTPRGLLLIDPSDRGLRVLEICILADVTR